MSASRETLTPFDRLRRFVEAIRDGKYRGAEARRIAHFVLDEVEHAPKVVALSVDELIAGPPDYNPKRDI